MGITAAQPPPAGPPARPAWEIAYLFPPQGHWSEGDYLSLSGNRLVEFCDGTVEVLPLATELHQSIVACLYGLVLAFVTPGGLGKVLFAPLPVRVVPRRFREPDVVFMFQRNQARRHNDYWDGADLVMEVVSDDDRRRDLETKRFEYAQTGIPEYWIVDPQRQEITVLRLAGDRYEEHGVFTSGQRATSPTLDGFSVDVAAVFAVR